MSRPSCDSGSGEILRIVGKPAYLSQNDPNSYVHSAITDAPILWDKFSAIYAAVFSSLGEFLGRRISVSAVAALPGFHVIRTTDRIPRYHGGVPHTDLSHLHVPALSLLGHAAEQYSFTLLLSEEAKDIGLEYWSPEINESTVNEREPLGRLLYRTGVLVVFSSSLVHRIAPFEGPRERITFQGHLIRRDDRFIAYW